MNPSDIQRVRQLSSQLKSFGMKPKPVIQKPTKPKSLDFIMKYKPVKQQTRPILSPFLQKKPKSTLIIQRGKDGVDGKDANEESIVERIMELMRKEYPSDEMAFMDRLIERIKKEKLIDVSNIRNAESFIYGGTKYKISELMHGGSSSLGTQIYGEMVSGSGTSWTLAQTPNSGTLRLYANGQRLALTTDYTISAATITTVLSWVAGTLLADYSYT